MIVRDDKDEGKYEGKDESKNEGEDEDRRLTVEEGMGNIYNSRHSASSTTCWAWAEESLGRILRRMQKQNTRAAA